MNNRAQLTTPRWIPVALTAAAVLVVVIAEGRDHAAALLIIGGLVWFAAHTVSFYKPSGEETENES